MSHQKDKLHHQVLFQKNCIHSSKEWFNLAECILYGYLIISHSNERHWILGRRLNGCKNSKDSFEISQTRHLNCSSFRSVVQLGVNRCHRLDRFAFFDSQICLQKRRKINRKTFLFQNVFIQNLSFHTFKKK